MVPTCSFWELIRISRCSYSCLEWVQHWTVLHESQVSSAGPWSKHLTSLWFSSPVWVDRDYGDFYNILWGLIKKKMVAVKSIANPQLWSTSFYADVTQMSSSCDKSQDRPTVIAWLLSPSETDEEGSVCPGWEVLLRLLPACTDLIETCLFSPRSLLPQEYQICHSVSLSSWNVQWCFKYLGCFQVPAVSSWKGLFQARPSKTRWTVHAWMVLSTWIHVKQANVSWKSLRYDKV